MKVNIYTKLPDIASESEVVLTPICSFNHVFRNIEKGENGVGRLASGLVYSRSDYDGYRRYTSWSKCHKERLNPKLVKEIDEFTEALFLLPEFTSSSAMKRLCAAYTEPTRDEAEHSLYSET